MFLLRPYFCVNLFDAFRVFKVDFCWFANLKGSSEYYLSESLLIKESASALPSLSGLAMTYNLPLLWISVMYRLWGTLSLHGNIWLPMPCSSVQTCCGLPRPWGAVLLSIQSVVLTPKLYLCLDCSLLEWAVLSTIMMLDLSIPSGFTASAMLLMYNFYLKFPPSLHWILTHTSRRKICLCLVVNYWQFLGSCESFFPVLVPSGRVESNLIPVPCIDGNYRVITVISLC